VEEIIQEFASGMDMGREQLNALLIKMHPLDKITTEEVSRLARSVHHACHILEGAIEKQLIIQCGSLVLDCTSGPPEPYIQFTYIIFAAFAEMERGTTVGRIKSGLKTAKENGSKMGRPKKTAKDVPQAVVDLLPRYQAGEFDKSEYARRAKVGRTALYKYLRLLGEVITPEQNKTTVSDIPPQVLQLYEDYQNGQLRKTDFAKLAGISRPTLDKYLQLLESSV
jgi:DNA invertase Pin-like site-specific DNA recombinase